MASSHSVNPDLMSLNNYLSVLSDSIQTQRTYLSTQHSPKWQATAGSRKRQAPKGREQLMQRKNLRDISIAKACYYLCVINAVLHR
jgi:hypothetical protein